MAVEIVGARSCKVGGNLLAGTQHLTNKDAAIVGENTRRFAYSQIFWDESRGKERGNLLELVNLQKLHLNLIDSKPHLTTKDDAPFLERNKVQNTSMMQT